MFFDIVKGVFSKGFLREGWLVEDLIMYSSHFFALLKHPYRQDRCRFPRILIEKTPFQLFQELIGLS